VGGKWEPRLVFLGEHRAGLLFGLRVLPLIWPSSMLRVRMIVGVIV